MDHVLTVTLFLLSVVAIGGAIECYSCNHTIGCQDMYEGQAFKGDNVGVTTVECDKCQKIIMPAHGLLSVSRGCNIRTSTSLPLACSTSDAGFVERCYCGTKLCNNTNKITLTNSVVFFFGTILLFFRL